MLENKKSRVLIVEDEVSMSKALQLKLSHAGFDVEPLYTGQGVIEKLKEKDFDLMLLDLMLPEVHGYEVLEKMKEEGIKTKVMILSNLSQKEDEDKVKALGVDSYFVKSNVSIEDIISKIKDTLS